MTHVGYIIAAYAATFGAVGAYAAWLLARSRAVTRTLEAQNIDRASPSAEQP